MLTVEQVVYQDAPRPQLLSRAQPPRDLTVVAGKTSEVLHATPMVPMVDAALDMVIAARRPISK